MAQTIASLTPLDKAIVVRALRTSIENVKHNINEVKSDKALPPLRREQYLGAAERDLAHVERVYNLFTKK